jgi:hypothetical protein
LNLPGALVADFYHILKTYTFAKTLSNQIHFDMLKFLIILALTVYVISKIGSFFFRAGASSSQSRYQQRRPADGKTYTDSPPRKERKNATIKGGDYVDYEEVK